MITAPASARPHRANALHSAKTCEHGSPDAAVELARYTLGGIDFDPASNAYWNEHVVRARLYCDRRSDGLKQPWSGRVFCNPPGADEAAGTENLVRPFWERMVAHWREGLIDGGVWLGYSLEQLATLQGGAAHPLMFLTLVPCERFRFLEARRGAPPVLRRVTVERVVDGRAVLVPTDKDAGPTHGNFLTLLPTRRSESEARAQVARFKERAVALTTAKGSVFGALVRPV